MHKQAICFLVTVEFSRKNHHIFRNYMPSNFVKGTTNESGCHHATKAFLGAETGLICGVLPSMNARS